MDNQKLENLLNLSLETAPEKREKSPVLESGFQPQTNSWTLIVRFLGSLDFLSPYNITVTYLLGNYAILEVPENLIPFLSEREEIIYIEKPTNLYFTVLRGRSASCINAVQQNASAIGITNNGLFGSGCLIAIIDSGIDYANDVFRNADGSTRILGLWDQTVSGNPPSGYFLGSYYTREQINEALQISSPEERRQFLPSVDTSGHGTAVASIAAGNFSSGRREMLGIAPASDILAVKLGTPSPNSFPRTSELMQAVDFCVKKSNELKKPLAINLSFGNNYGSHTGTSLLETYLDEAASAGRNNLIIGMGNEGNSANHFSSNLAEGETIVCELFIAPFEPNINVQIWKSYSDTIEMELESPSGTTYSISAGRSASFRFQSSGTTILVYYGEPAPYSIYQEIFLDFLPAGLYVSQGIWKFSFKGVKITDGLVHLWLPSGASLNGSQFLSPVPYSTLTIPSTSRKSISVGAYDALRQSYASFSGRGSFDFSILQKPDLSAPGVDIVCAVPGGGFVQNSGTSMAAPFVTGAAALLMEWGILLGNDPFLYGEKLKAYLIKGARKLPLFETWPNPQLGWGVLCVRDSLPF